jgi:Response regulators consisting of a CheY-like receiver domain and a winged-helix DNA-binding domain
MLAGLLLQDAGGGLSMAKEKILLVDDELDFVEVARLRLENSGYEVIVAYDGVEGLEKAKIDKPDLIILDIMMPKMNGFDVCRKLKIDKNFKNIPIIMLTAKYQPNDIRFGTAMGADEYLTKPFEPQILLDKIRELLDKKKAS